MRLIRITDLAIAGKAKSEGIRKLKLRSYAKEKNNPGMLKTKSWRWWNSTRQATPLH